MHQCAILDDYQDVAKTMADWRPLEGAVELRVFTDHVAEREAQAAASRISTSWWRCASAPASTGGYSSSFPN